MITLFDIISHLLVSCFDMLMIFFLKIISTKKSQAKQLQLKCTHKLGGFSSSILSDTPTENAKIYQVIQPPWPFFNPQTLEVTNNPSKGHFTIPKRSPADLPGIGFSTTESS